MKRLILTSLLATAALLGAIAPAGLVSANGKYPPGRLPTIFANVSSIQENEEFTVTVENCAPGQPVIFRFRNQTVSTTCDLTLTASATFTPRVKSNNSNSQKLTDGDSVVVDVPSEGPYDVCADVTMSRGDVELCTVVEVLADAPPEETTSTTVAPSTTLAPSGGGAPSGTTPAGGLPATGSNGLGTTTSTAIVLIVAGALLLIVTQVRRRRAAL